MKKILFILLLLIAGIGVGGGTAYALTTFVLSPPAPAGADANGEDGATDADADSEEPEGTFIPAGSVLAPLAFEDGRVASYSEFQIALEVPAEMADHVTARLPLLFHEINLRSWKTPLAAGPDGLLADVDRFREIVDAAAQEVFEEGTVMQVAVTDARPA